MRSKNEKFLIEVSIWRDEEGQELLANTTVQAWLLILVLAFYTSSLIQDTFIIHRMRAKQARDGRTNPGLVYYGHPDGIDVYGMRLVASTRNVKRNILFLLRDDNLHDDLKFWNAVEALLSSREDIRLIGYCDSQQCVESVRATHLSFPVLTSGEAVGIQALVNADENGKAIFQIVGSAKSSTMLWRAAESTPQSAAREASR